MYPEVFFNVSMITEVECVTFTFGAFHIFTSSLLAKVVVHDTQVAPNGIPRTGFVMRLWERLLGIFDMPAYRCFQK